MKILGLFALATLAQPALAEEIETRLTVSDYTTNVVLDLNADTVKCLVGGYGMSSLKISVPQLNYLATFNHTTFGETLPCINAGPCKSEFDIPGMPTDGLLPSDVLDKGGPQESVPLRVQLEEIYFTNETQKTCHRQLTETVTTTVRGLAFKHINTAALVSLPYEKCDVILK